jgi:hypothetical protein
LSRFEPPKLAGVRQPEWLFRSVVYTALALLVALALLLAGYLSPGRVPALPPVPAHPSGGSVTVATTTGTIGPSAPLPVVSGSSTTTSVPLTGGTASLSGTVLGPDAIPLPGATVSVERIVGSAQGEIYLDSGPNGSWSAPNLLGGLYLVRAWMPPSMAMAAPVSYFLPAGQQHQITLGLAQYGSNADLGTSVAPDPPVVGVPTDLAVEVSVQVVTPAGQIVGTPIANATVELSPGGAWTLDSSSATSTGSDGAASFLLTCQAPGAQSISATVTVDASSLPGQGANSGSTTTSGGALSPTFFPAANPIEPPTTVSETTVSETLPVKIPACVNPPTSPTGSSSSSVATGTGSTTATSGSGAG